MKKAIAMKCNQEQWDSIKGKLVGFKIYATPEFKNFPYLANNSGGDRDVINNFSSLYKSDYNREVHETWNEQIFLEACGIETEKIFKGSELQMKQRGKWIDLSSDLEYRLKSDNTAKIAELKEQIKQLENE